MLIDAFTWEPIKPDGREVILVQPLNALSKLITAVLYLNKSAGILVNETLVHPKNTLLKPVATVLY